MILYSLAFISFSILLFILSISSNKWILHGFSLATFINIVPFFWLPYVGMDSARFYGIPLSYIPYISIGLAYVFRTRLVIQKRDIDLVIMASIFLVYLFFQSFFRDGVTTTTAIYFLSWPLNFLFLISTLTFFSKLPSCVTNNVIISSTTIFFIGAIIGIFRYLTGINDDANFMPFVNRNGTVVIVVMVMPMFYYLYQNYQISITRFFAVLLTMFSCLLLIFSRSGLLGFIFTIVYVFFKIKSKNIIIIFLCCISFASIALFTPSSNYLILRFDRSIDTVQMVFNNKTIDSNMSDYNRIMLFKSAIEISKNNLFFGSGLGLENYRREFSKYSNHTHNSQAHNFYLTYFAQLGFVGFSMLMFFFYLLYKKIQKGKKNKPIKAVFWTIALMMTMNEYIIFPEIWLFIGMIIGLSRCENNELIGSYK